MENNKIKNSTPSSLGEISMIRDILMGEHIHQFDQQFEKQEIELKRVEKDFSDRLQQLKSQMEQRMDAMERAYNERFDRLEKLLDNRTNELKELIHATSDTDRKNIGNLLGEISQKLLS